ncbi:sensor domain-containing phosphodiesterase [Miltoncostaea oceani]|uniref:sensor domain-containing phosphodiesterase n=1 Tax=Miltoncostaea oceani TaxID=2843216 RepID=UPI003CCEC167
MAFLARVRRMGWGVALDDVGVDPCSLALLPVVRPDVVKLDRSLLQGPRSRDTAAILRAVAAECERTGALMLAEGIEDGGHRRLAAASGAVLGQGWYFGRPGPLAAGVRTGWRPPRLPELHAATDGSTPFTVVAAGRAVRRAGWRTLLEVSDVLETHARHQGPEALVVSAFQDASRFTPRTAERYRLLARDAAFVAALGVGMARTPVAGVRGATLRPDDPLRGEWSVVVLGPRFAGALVSREVPDDRPGRPVFDFAVTYDRDLVVRAATALLRQVVRHDA